MITNDVFSSVLMEPALLYGSTRLQIVSGFATASMAQRHLESLKNSNANTSIELIVGMTNHSGIEKAQHRALCQLAQDRPYGMDFSCRYIAQNRPVHAKCFVWSNEAGPFMAFCGSANYTMAGFIRSQIEAMTEADPASVASFYRECLPYTVDCLDESILEHVHLIETRRIADEETEDTMTLSLLVRSTGETHRAGGGLNWGQPTPTRDNRDRNQSYIAVPSSKREFFPPLTEQFTVLTDDGFPFVFVVAQGDKGKALHTPQRNALLGEYIRSRMGMPSGEFIERKHLEDYGRTDVTFTKIDEETYLMDFSPNIENEHKIESGEAND